MKKIKIFLIIYFFASIFLAKAEQTDTIQNNHVYFGILAGGSGERLWPLSNAQQPKQLLPFLNDKTLLEETIDRISPLASTKENIFIVTCTEQIPLIQEIITNKIGFFVEEPCGKNTAPAILLSCHKILEKDSQATIVFLPVDHFIPNGELFRKILQKTIDYTINSTNISILGLKPTFPATGYGYIQADFGKQPTTAKFLPVKQFCEKPEKTVAEKYVQQNDMFWNVGIVMAKASVLINEFNNYLPDLSKLMNQYLDNKIKYDQLPKTCVSRGLLEKSSNIVVYPADFEWYDVGNIDVFLTLQAKHSSTAPLIINVDCENNLANNIQNKKIICIGINDIRIIETNDILLIVHKDYAETVNSKLCNPNT